MPPPKVPLASLVKNLQTWLAWSHEPEGLFTLRTTLEERIVDRLQKTPDRQKRFEEAYRDDASLFILGWFSRPFQQDLLEGKGTALITKLIKDSSMALFYLQHTPNILQKPAFKFYLQSRLTKINEKEQRGAPLTPENAARKELFTLLVNSDPALSALLTLAQRLGSNAENLSKNLFLPLLSTLATMTESFEKALTASTEAEFYQHMNEIEQAGKSFYKQAAKPIKELLSQLTTFNTSLPPNALFQGLPLKLLLGAPLSILSSMSPLPLLIPVIALLWRLGQPGNAPDTLEAYSQSVLSTLYQTLYQDLSFKLFMTAWIALMPETAVSTSMRAWLQNPEGNAPAPLLALVEDRLNAFLVPSERGESPFRRLGPSITGRTPSPLSTSFPAFGSPSSKVPQTPSSTTSATPTPGTPETPMPETPLKPK